MKYCKKCGKNITSDNEGNHGLCLYCYQKFLYEKIDHLGEKQSKQPKSPSKISSLFKKIFNKYK